MELLTCHFCGSDKIRVHQQHDMKQLAKKSYVAGQRDGFKLAIDSLISTIKQYGDKMDELFEENLKEIE